MATLTEKAAMVKRYQTGRMATRREANAAKKKVLADYKAGLISRTERYAKMKDLSKTAGVNLRAARTANLTERAQYPKTPAAKTSFLPIAPRQTSAQLKERTLTNLAAQTPEYRDRLKRFTTTVSRGSTTAPIGYPIPGKGSGNIYMPGETTVSPNYWKKYGRTDLRGKPLKTWKPRTSQYW